jgi:hypothetical protein
MLANTKRGKTMLNQTIKNLAAYLQTIYTADYLKKAFHAFWETTQDDSHVHAILQHISAIDWHYSPNEIKAALLTIAKEKSECRIIVRKGIENVAQFAANHSGLIEASGYAQFFAKDDDDDDSYFLSINWYYKGEQFAWYENVIASFNFAGLASICSERMVSEALDLQIDC